MGQHSSVVLDGCHSSWTVRWAKIFFKLILGPVAFVGNIIISFDVEHVTQFSILNM